MMYPAVVVDRNDPQIRKRVRVTCPALYGTTPMWAEACLPSASSPVPDVGEQVWIALVADNKKVPVWLGVQIPR